MLVTGTWTIRDSFYTDFFLYEHGQCVLFSVRLMWFLCVWMWSVDRSKIKKRTSETFFFLLYFEDWNSHLWPFKLNIFVFSLWTKSQTERSKCFVINRRQQDYIILTVTCQHIFIALVQLCVSLVNSLFLPLHVEKLLILCIVVGSCHNM